MARPVQERPVLIFVNELETALALERAMPSSRVIDAATGPLALRRIMTDHANGELVTIIATRSMLTGWRAPRDTIVLFSADFPVEGGWREQALGRVPA